MFLRNARWSIFTLALCTPVVAFGQTHPETAPESVIENVFQPGVMAIDTNGDHIANAICGKVIVASSPSAAENTAAANLGARLGYETSALSLPIVVSATPDAPPAALSKGSGDSCPAVNTNLWVGRAAYPGPLPAPVESLLSGLQIGEGEIFAVPGGLLLAGNDPAGTLVAGDGYAAHAPFQWSVSAAKLSEIAADVNARLKDQKVGGTALLVGVTYGSGLAGIRQAVLAVSGNTGPSVGVSQAGRLGGAGLRPCPS